MASSSNGDGGRPQKLSQSLSGRLSGLSATFLRPPKPKNDGEPVDPKKVLSPDERRAAMSGLDPIEVKWSKAGLTLAAALGIIIPIIESSTHPIRKVTSGKQTGYVVTSGTWLLIGLIVVAFCALGFWALRRRKRSLVVFTFFVVGFSFTLVFAPLGFALILLGGWLLLRAYRIQKYGTANAKTAAKEAAARPPRRERKQAASAPPKPTGYKTPTANKRYTPKAPVRKRVAKPTE